jgi:hypothetical protein
VVGTTQLTLFPTSIGSTSKSVLNMATTNLLSSNSPTKCDTTVSSNVTEDLLHQKLKDSKEWKEVALLCDSGNFGDAPQEINKKFALSFLA